MSISSWIAKVGTNPTWIAANAHCWFACYVVMLTHGDPWVVCAALLAAAAKEFWFDATYETPKQSFDDNLQDFTGYCLGLFIGSMTTMLT